jgi:hypothetical protein
MMSNQIMTIKILDLQAKRIRTVKINSENFGANLLIGFVEILKDEKRMLGHQNLNIMQEVIALINGLDDPDSYIQVYTDTGERIFIDHKGSWGFFQESDKKPILYWPCLKELYKNFIRLFKHSPKKWPMAIRIKRKIKASIKEDKK